MFLFAVHSSRYADLVKAFQIKNLSLTVTSLLINKMLQKDLRVLVHPFRRVFRLCNSFHLLLWVQLFLLRAGGLRRLGGDWIFILQFNVCHVLTASAKHNEHDSANDSDGQETADSHNGDHIGRQSCSLILASSSFWFYKSYETTCQKLVNISLWLHRWYIFSISKGWKTQRKETW